MATHTRLVEGQGPDLARIIAAIEAEGWSVVTMVPTRTVRMHSANVVAQMLVTLEAR